MGKKEKKIVCVVQARTGSTRLPGKVLLDLMGKPVLSRVIERILPSKKINQIVVATTDKKEDLPIVNLVKSRHSVVNVFRGSENDILDRCYKAIKKYNPGAMVRITADCPVIDYEIIDMVIDAFLEPNVDYASNTLGEKTYPRGLDVEAFSFKVLEKIWKELKGKEEREYPSLFIRENPNLFKCKRVVNNRDYSFHRWTLDETDDYKLIKIIYQELYPKNPKFLMKDIIELFERKPELIKINQHVEQRKKNY